MDSHGNLCINDASGVKPKAAPAVRDGQSCSIDVREIVAGDSGSSKPPRRLSGGKCSGSCTVSCAARCRRHRRQRRHEGPHLCGHECMARCTECRALLGAVVHDGVRRQPARASEASNATSAASRRPSEARNERSEWRREGYPPEGSRPRSGLGRVARSRSDAPSLVVCIREPVTTIGTIGCITTGTAVVGNRRKVIIITTAGITINTGGGVSVGIIDTVGGVVSTVCSCRATRGVRMCCTR